LQRAQASNFESLIQERDELRDPRKRKVIAEAEGVEADTGFAKIQQQFAAMTLDARVEQAFFASEGLGIQISRDALAQQLEEGTLDARIEAAVLQNLATKASTKLTGSQTSFNAAQEAALTQATDFAAALQPSKLLEFESAADLRALQVGLAGQEESAFAGRLERERELHTVNIRALEQNVAASIDAVEQGNRDANRADEIFIQSKRQFEITSNLATRRVEIESGQYDLQREAQASADVYRNKALIIEEWKAKNQGEWGQTLSAFNNYYEAVKTKDVDKIEQAGLALDAFLRPSGETGPGGVSYARLGMFREQTRMAMVTESPQIAGRGDILRILDKMGGGLSPTYSSEDYEDLEAAFQSMVMWMSRHGDAFITDEGGYGAQGLTEALRYISIVYAQMLATNSTKALAFTKGAAILTLHDVAITSGLTHANLFSPTALDTTRSSAEAVAGGGAAPVGLINALTSPTPASVPGAISSPNPPGGLESTATTAAGTEDGVNLVQESRRPPATVVTDPAAEAPTPQRPALEGMTSRKIAKLLDTSSGQAISKIADTFSQTVASTPKRTLTGGFASRAGTNTFERDYLDRIDGLVEEHGAANFGNMEVQFTLGLNMTPSDPTIVELTTAMTSNLESMVHEGRFITSTVSEVILEMYPIFGANPALLKIVDDLESKYNITRDTSAGTLPADQALELMFSDLLFQLKLTDPPVPSEWDADMSLADGIRLFRIEEVANEWVESQGVFTKNMLSSLLADTTAEGDRKVGEVYEKLITEWVANDKKNKALRRRR
jgi:hypothetical protein